MQNNPDAKELDMETVSIRGELGHTILVEPQRRRQAFGTPLDPVIQVEQKLSSIAVQRRSAVQNIGSLGDVATKADP